MERLSIEEYGCLLSLIGKSRSEDYFTKCSAVGISEDKRILGISYNGLSSGMEVPEWMTQEENRPRKSELYIHAEANLFSLIEGNKCDTVCLNISPCISCCNIIAAHRVRRVVYLKQYPRCDKFKDFFSFHGIEYEMLPEVGKDKLRAYLTQLNNFPELFD